MVCNDLGVKVVLSTFYCIMKNKILLLSLTSFFTIAGYSQNASVNGVVTDSSKKAPIVLASIAILRQKDSVLEAYGRSDKQGRFVIPHLKGGDYILLITFPKYVDFVENFSVTSGQSKDVNRIYLTETAKLLDEIVIKRPPISLKGDTTEYDAGSFKVRENATAEELLMELPGIQVDKDGKIIAQGKQVQKVLVDGDEFFSDDPTVATKNLRADAISKVQVFDKKSDQAAFTGIDDGQEQKTINFKLKDGAKKGYFGKLSVAGLDKYYNVTGMLNSFKDSRKLSVFGVASSTSNTGLNWGDQSSLGFSGGGRGFFSGGGDGGPASISIVAGGSGGGGLDAGSDYGQGLPESIKAGAHYSDKWNGGKNSAGGNYLVNKLNTRSAGNTFSQNTLFDSVYYSKNASSSHSSQVQQSLSGTMELNLDSSSQLTVRVNGNTGTSDSYGDNSSEALSEALKTVNSSMSTTSSHSDNSTMNSSLFYRKRFKKPGRTISINVSQNYNDSKSNGYLDNVAKFFDNDGNQVNEALTDQNKVNTSLNQTWQGRASYTNPLGKKSYFEINYSFNNNNSYQKKLSYNKDGDGKYKDLVDSLSSDFRYIYNTHSGGLNYRYNGKAFSFNLGGTVSRTGFEQDDRFENTKRRYSYTNLFPRGNFRFKINSSSNIEGNYSGSTTQPTIDQLQPLKNNSDPMNIVVGNPDLKQSFSNSFSLNYNSFQMMNEQYFFTGLNYNTTSDQISSSYIIDSFGRRVTKYINVDGNNSFNVYGNYNRKLGKTRWEIGISPNFYISKNTNYINGKQNVSRSYTISPELSFSNRNVEKYDFEIEYSPSYSSSKSSISTVAGQNYWTHNISSDIRYTFPWKIDLGTDVEFEFRQKLNASDTKNQLILWNAYLEKRMLKKEQLSIRLSMHDILNQNKGYERTINSNAIVESRYLTFQRYGLITITYNFNTTGTGKQGGPPPPGRRFFRRH